MEINQLLGYVMACLVGVSLGLMGSGGSILTVPILVYLLGIAPVLATAYSLFIVGVTAFTGTIKNLSGKEIDFKKVLVFGLPSVFAVFATRLWIVPNLPEQLFSVGTYAISKSTAIMVLFAILMIFSAVSMLRKSTNKNSVVQNKIKKDNFQALFVLGLIIGCLAGLVGAGGGFLIIPALVVLANTPIKTATATSLCIVSVQSLLGFFGDLQTGATIDWLFLICFSLASVVGIFIGLALAKRISSEKLKKGFGWFVAVIAIYILVKELY